MSKFATEYCIGRKVRLSLLALLLSLTACKIPLGKGDDAWDETVLIIGIGVVSTKGDEKAAAVAVNSASIGFSYENLGVERASLGYANTKGVIVRDKEANMLIEFNHEEESLFIDSTRSKEELTNEQ